MTEHMKRLLEPGIRSCSLLISLAVMACASEGLTPAASPAAEHPAYAAEYPSRVESVGSQYDTESKWAAELIGKFSSYPGELDDPNWKHVERTYELADSDGRSAHYADVQKNNTAVAAFFVEEQEELVKRAGGAVQYEAEQDGCKGQYYGAVSRGLERAVEERLEKRAEDSSQARRYIQDHEAALGKETVEILERQATEISLAANLVFVGLAEHHQELQSLVEEASTVEATIERRLEELKTPAEADASEDAVAKRKHELEALSRAQGELKAARASAEKKLEKSEEQIEQARARYQKEFDALMKTVSKKARD